MSGRYTKHQHHISGLSLNTSKFFQSARVVVTSTAGARPDVLKVIIGFDVIDILLTALYFLTGATGLPMRTNLALHAVLAALPWGLLWLLWMGSRPARIGLFVYSVVSWAATVYALVKNGLGTPISFAGDIANLFVCGSLAVLLWLPSLVAWLAGVAERRKALPLVGQEAFVKCALYVGLAWTVAPLLVATGGKHAHRLEGSPMAAFAVSLPLVAIGLVVLAVQATKWLRLRKANRPGPGAAPVQTLAG